MESKSPARGRSRTPKPATGRRASSKGKHVTTKAHASPAPSASPHPPPPPPPAVHRAATPHVKLEDAVPASPTSPTPQKCVRGTARGLWRCTVIFWHWICTRVVLVGAAVVILGHPPSTLTVHGRVFFLGSVFQTLVVSAPSATHTPPHPFLVPDLSHTHPTSYTLTMFRMPLALTALAHRCERTLVL